MSPIRIDLTDQRVRRLLASVLRHNRESTGLEWPTPLVNIERALLQSISGHSPTLADIVLELTAVHQQAATMSYTEAANHLGYTSTKTITRLVQQGRLTKLGRRITTVSVAKLVDRG